MLPCAECAYSDCCMKWAIHFCPDFKPKSLPPPTGIATRRVAENRSLSSAPRVIPITLLRSARNSVRLRA